jgi:hypothetical protein
MKINTVNQFLFASEKISQGLQAEPHCRKYFSLQTRCFMQFHMNEEYLIAKIARRLPVYHLRITK